MTTTPVPTTIPDPPPEQTAEPFVAIGLGLAAVLYGACQLLGTRFIVHRLRQLMARP